MPINIHILVAISRNISLDIINYVLKYVDCRSWNDLENFAKLMQFYKGFSSIVKGFPCLVSWLVIVATEDIKIWGRGACSNRTDFLVTKGQLNSESIYEVIVSPKIPTKDYRDFCPGSLSSDYYFKVSTKRSISSCKKISTYFLKYPFRHLF